MVVALGDVPEAYAIYPGGQSGQPGSRYYDNSIDDWVRGHSYRLQYFMSEQEAEERAMSRQTIEAP